MWQYETGSGSARATSHHDLLNKLVSFVTSKGVATVAINAAGTAYTVGDVLTLTHAGAHLDAKFEVTSISGGGGTGPITGLRKVANGAFGDRPNGSITISAGGTGYDASATDIILEIQGGSSRCPAKVQATVDGGGIVISAVAFEDLGTAGLGIYSSLPSYPAATEIVGPNGAAAGTGCTITMGGSTGLVGTTGLAVTGGTGSSATVDITLADTGWSIHTTNTNNRSLNSVLNEKDVVLKGDSAGTTNKPYVAYISSTSTSGLTTRSYLACYGMITHNPSIAIEDHTFHSPSFTVGMNDAGSYLLCSQDTGGGADEMDFWFSIDDQTIRVLTQIKSSAVASDDGIYMQHYIGYMDRFGTETESPYPYFVFASSRAQNIDPGAQSNSITSLAEHYHTGSGPGWYWNNITSAWISVQNDDSVGTPAAEETVMQPVGKNRENTSGTAADDVVRSGSLNISGAFFENDRSSATRILRKIPGTVDAFFLWPLTIMRKPASSSDPIEDKLIGQLRGVFWLSSDDGTGNRIINFSEDFVTIAGDRYKVFHNHVHTEPYQYIAVKENV
jgi:hypothetical protein